MPEIFVASDHRGFDQKQAIVAYLERQHLSVTDLGPAEYDPEDDYPMYARKVARAVKKANTAATSSGHAAGGTSPAQACGVLICGSAHGIAIQANRFPGIRAIAAYNEDLAAIGREHNDANILCLSADFNSLEENEKILLRFLAMPFSNEPRHIRRINQLDRPLEQPNLSDASLILTEVL